MPKVSRSSNPLTPANNFFRERSGVPFFVTLCKREKLKCFLALFKPTQRMGAQLFFYKSSRIDLKVDLKRLVFDGLGECDRFCLFLILQKFLLR